MAKFLIVFVAALVFSAALAAPKKKQHAAATDDTLAARIDKLKEDIGKALEQAIPSSEDVRNKLIEGSKTLATSLENSLHTIQEEIQKHKGEADEFVQNQLKNLGSAVEGFKANVGPDATKKFNEIKTHVDTHLQEIARNMKDVDTAIKNNLSPVVEKVQHFLENALKDMAQNTEAFVHQVKEVVDKNAQPQQ